MPQHAMCTEQVVGRLVAYWGNNPPNWGRFTHLGGDDNNQGICGKYDAIRDKTITLWNY